MFVHSLIAVRYKGSGREVKRVSIGPRPGSMLGVRRVPGLEKTVFTLAPFAFSGLKCQNHSVFFTMGPTIHWYLSVSLRPMFKNTL